MFVSLSKADIGKVHKGCSPAIIILTSCWFFSVLRQEHFVFRHFFLAFCFLVSRAFCFLVEKYGLKSLHSLTVDSHEHDLHLGDISGLNGSESNWLCGKSMFIL